MFKKRLNSRQNTQVKFDLCFKKQKGGQTMKREFIEAALGSIKDRLVSSDLKSAADCLKEKSRVSRDFIEVKTLIEVFEKMAGERQ